MTDIDTTIFWEHKVNQVFNKILCFRSCFMGSLFLGMMRFSSHVYFWKEESKRETGMRNVGVMTETPDMEQILVCSSISAAWTWPNFISCQCVSMCQLAGAGSCGNPPLWAGAAGLHSSLPGSLPGELKGGRTLKVVCGSMAEPQPPAWITEHFGSGASSVWVLFLNSPSPCLCSSEGFSLMPQHFPL